MTFGEITRQVLIEGGMSPEVVDKRMKDSRLSMPPGVIDEVIPPEHVETVRANVRQLQAEAKANPVAADLELRGHVRRINAQRRNN
ncbi:MAG: hypothetical protein AB7O65_09815 [Candidatus Korobacteraceae bacterium]